MKSKDRKKSSTKKAGGRMARPTPMGPARIVGERALARSIERNRQRASARAEGTKRERERAMEILAEGRGGPMSEFDRIKSKL